jgi:hypothetical protein
MAMMASFTKAMESSLTKAMEAQASSQNKVLERLHLVATESAGPDPDPLEEKEVPPLVSKESRSGVLVQASSVAPPLSQNSGGATESSQFQSGAPVDNSVIESDDDKDLEDSEVRTSKECHSKRRKVVASTLAGDPNFQFEAPTSHAFSAESCAMFGFSSTESVSDVLPVQKGLYDEIKRFAAVRATRGHKAPDKVLRKMYRVPEPQISHWNAPPNVDEQLLHVVDHKKVKYMPKQKQWVLHPDQDAGKKEKVLVENLARQQLLLKISNCLSLSVVASNVMLTRAGSLVSQIPELMKDPDFDMLRHLEVLRSTIVNIGQAFSEVQVNSIDVMKLAADSTLSICQERRKLWTEASNLKKEQVVALNDEPVFTPQDPSVSGWPILGPEMSKRVHQWTESTNTSLNVQASQKVLGMNFQSNRPAANRQPKGGKNKNQGKKGQGKTQPQQNFRAAAESANQGANSGQNKTAPAKGKPFNRGNYKKRGGKK